MTTSSPLVTPPSKPPAWLVGRAQRPLSRAMGSCAALVGRLLVVDGEDRILGTVGYFRPAHYIDGYELAYVIFEHIRRGRGIATEAVSLMIDFLFSAKKIGRVQAALMPENAPSRRVVEKCGFQREGVMRRAAFIQGRSTDLELWSLLREEWEERRAAAVIPE